MNLRNVSIFSAVSALLAGGAMLQPAAAPAQSPAAPDVQILTRGPVHEAFAEAVSFNPQTGLVVHAAPPKPIEELPPEQQLVGDNVTWIPGYWAWDDERSDFLWISGIWRNLPPGRQWIPGYWSAISTSQYQWTSGYWADSTTTEVAYLAAPPPRNIDVGPNIAATSDDQNWIPGNWVWNQNRYLWRPGYWMALRQNWTWVPSRYNWTHRGYVYVDGYWDYAVANRGVLFAPVCFNRPVYDSPDYYYTPSIVIGFNVFADHLFVRPRCGHYYFGDYYASRYRDDGYYTSDAWCSSNLGYDPIYAYDRWSHRADRGWQARRSANFAFFSSHEDVRPQHTWAAMQTAGRNHYNDGRNRIFASTLAIVASTPAEGQRFRSLDRVRREQIVSQAQQVTKFGQARHQVETRDTVFGPASSKSAGRESLTRSPIVGRQPEHFASHEAPPQRPEARGPNINVNPATTAKLQQGTARTDATRKLAGRQSPAAGKTSDRATAAVPQQPRSNPKLSASSASHYGSGPNALRQPSARQADAGKGTAQNLTAKQLPGYAPDTTKRQLQTQVTPQRQTQAPSQIRQAPQRQVQAAPQQHQAPPQPQVRQAPQRQVQAAPQQHQAPPQPQVRQAPQRQVQAAPQQHQAAPQPQVRQAPQRQVQAAPQQHLPPPQPQQVRQAPQRQAQTAPQRQAQAATPSPATDDRNKKKKDPTKN